ncbi:hypothetical protein [Nocardioides sp. R-C-SC26]|uniref:hypothetical protein n=1 Tax=Nocardioides sp. R-C-SC26 TaxID=2870414 RepID=UPI001E3B100E|nr:hypothetical protein [Nocardioides sp. R-C-SC26]
MGQALSKTVVAGGVVYPVGTPATKELLRKIDARHWEGEPDRRSRGGSTGSESSDLKEALAALERRDQELAELRANAEGALVTLRDELVAVTAERDAFAVRIAELEVQVAASQAAGGSPDGGPTGSDASATGEGSGEPSTGDGSDESVKAGPVDPYDDTAQAAPAKKSASSRARTAAKD